MPVHLALLLAALLLAACGNFSHLEKEVRRGTPVPRVLDAKDTRKVAKAWRQSGFDRQVRTYEVESNRTDLTTLIDAYEIRTRLPRTEGTVGIPVLVDTAPAPGVSVQIAPHAHVLTLQPATLVAQQTAANGLRLDLLDPRGSATHQGRPLTPDNGLVFDYILREQREGLLHVRGLFKPADYSDRRGFYLLTPYDRDKIPVVFIHGLASSPFTFREMILHLQRDPLLWDRYQFWFYLYPTGTPWLTSAAAFRKDLGELVTAVDPEGNDPHLHDMVVVGHSMGGLITRASISRPGEHLYRAYFHGDFATLPVSGEARTDIVRTLRYEPAPWPRRVVFLSTPHQGSRLAQGPLEWLARQTIRLPGRVLGGALQSLHAIATLDPGALTKAAHDALLDGEVSVTQLDAESPALQALQKMPLPKDVPVHSIIGDLGGPMGLFGTDGVVPYESAHLPGAESELVVHSHHSTGGNSRAAVEVARILRLHLR